MKIYRARLSDDSLTNWYHTKKEAKQWAKDYGYAWTSIETAKFEAYNVAENIRRFMNQDWKEEPYLTITIENK